MIDEIFKFVLTFACICGISMIVDGVVSLFKEHLDDETKNK